MTLPPNNTQMHNSNHQLSLINRTDRLRGPSMVKRIVLLGAALAVVGQAVAMAGPAIAKTRTRTCSSVTVGLYRASNVRVTPNLTCATARSDLRFWLSTPRSCLAKPRGGILNWLAGPGKWPMVVIR